jgi:DNA-binding transcriptional MerR regulator
MQWILRAQALGMPTEDIQAYLDAWAQPIAPVDPAWKINKRLRDRERMASKRAVANDVASESPPTEEAKKGPPDPLKETTKTIPSECQKEPKASVAPIFPDAED